MRKAIIIIVALVALFLAFDKYERARTAKNSQRIQKTLDETDAILEKSKADLAEYKKQLKEKRGIGLTLSEFRDKIYPPEDWVGYPNVPEPRFQSEYSNGKSVYILKHRYFNKDGSRVRDYYIYLDSSGNVEDWSIHNDTASNLIRVF